MDKAFDLLLCFAFSLVLGGTWGGGLYFFDPLLGVLIGFLLFLLCMLVLTNALRGHKKPEIKHNRRFNDA